MAEKYKKLAELQKTFKQLLSVNQSLPEQVRLKPAVHKRSHLQQFTAWKTYSSKDKVYGYMLCLNLTLFHAMCVGAAAGSTFQWAGRKDEVPARDGGQEAVWMGEGALQPSSEQTAELVLKEHTYSCLC